jgi:hypothetical protein
MTDKRAEYRAGGHREPELAEYVRAEESRKDDQEQQPARISQAMASGGVKRVTKDTACTHRRTCPEIRQRVVFEEIVQL